MHGAGRAKTGWSILDGVTSGTGPVPVPGAPRAQGPAVKGRVMVPGWSDSLP